MPAFIDIVKGQAVSLANQGLQKSIGNLKGVIGHHSIEGSQLKIQISDPDLIPKHLPFHLM